MGTTQLAIYNDALGHLEERRLATLTEQREPKRVLDSFYPSVVQYCLEMGLWRFAKRALQIDSSQNLTPQFGFNNAFAIPHDWCNTIIVSNSPNLDPPLLQYQEEAGFWYANGTPIYVSFVSNDPTYGLNLGLWPQSFADYVGLRLAIKSCKRITGSTEKADKLEPQEKNARRIAKAKDAMNDPPGLPPVAMWARARRGAFGPGGLWLGGGTGGSIVTGPAGDD